MRLWLEPESTGVDSYVRVEGSYDEFRGKATGDISFKLADCNRNVLLDFSFYNEAGRRRRIRKARKLLRAAERLVTLLEHPPEAAE